MDVQVQEKEAFELPMINPWRQAPSREAVRFAMDLCRTELPAAERTSTISDLRGMSRSDVSALIDRLKGCRAKRLRRAPRNRNWRLKL